MSIYFKYGNYSHAAGECQVTISRDAVRSQDGLSIIGHTTRYVLNGIINGTSTADINSKLRALENAYSYNFKDFGLYDSSSGRTTNWVKASDADIRVVSGPSYPEGGGAEYVTGRTYQIIIEARTGLLMTGIYDYQESVTISGGGPRVVWLEVLNGPPQKQIPITNSLCVVVQSGSASGARSYPAPSPPLFPGNEMEMPVIERRSPEILDNGRRMHYTTKWTYQFGLPARVDAAPHLRS